MQRKRSAIAAEAAKLRRLLPFTVEAYQSATDILPEGFFEVVASSENEALKLAARDAAAQDFQRLIVAPRTSPGVIIFTKKSAPKTPA